MPSCCTLRYTSILMVLNVDYHCLGHLQQLKNRRCNWFRPTQMWFYTNVVLLHCLAYSSSYEETKYSLMAQILQMSSYSHQQSKRSSPSTPCDRNSEEKNPLILCRGCLLQLCFQGPPNNFSFQQEAFSRKSILHTCRVANKRGYELKHWGHGLRVTLLQQPAAMHKVACPQDAVKFLELYCSMPKNTHQPGLVHSNL